MVLADRDLAMPEEHIVPLLMRPPNLMRIDTSAGMARQWVRQVCVRLASPFAHDLPHSNPRQVATTDGGRITAITEGGRITVILYSSVRRVG